MSKLKIGLGALLALITGCSSNGTLIEKYSAELTHTQGNDVLKIKPYDYTSPSDTQQLDLLMGKKFDNFTLYGYWKSDNKGKSWIGLRADYSMKALEGKLRTNLQLRGFKGMNDKSSNEFYFVPSTGYKVGKFSFGAIGYLKKSSGRDPCFFLGPSINAKLTDSMNMFVSYDWDVLSDNSMLYASAGFRF